MRKNIGISIYLGLFAFNMIYAKQTVSYYQSKGALIAGYDPVAYIKQNKAIKGQKDFEYKYDGTVIYFSSKANQQAFIDNPEAYLPQYKGWCAYAMADNGDLVEIDPETFKVIDGKVYLFYKGWLGNTLKKWNKQDDSSQIEQANQHWQQKHKP
ncbi:MAG TPA: YHS domain-containing (seleno)protein [Oligoflexia bacterium]|nr:YHS domain-containing (seleno)protein [Oligoflexia bacterium]HMR25604.1 YHS domain-containing (seleno)protein [Oligoflexia bacterium]